MKVDQIYTGCLAEAAYYIESKGEAVIIDPLRETTPYLEKLNKTGAQLKYILETHFHADFVSGHVDLAKKTGATIVYGPMADAEYDIYSASDGETLQVGDVQIKILHTPGHTMESSTFLLLDENGKEYAIFTGDTLFLGDVGRPDLAIKRGEITREDLAGFLYDSLRTKIMPLPDDVIVYPGHGAGSACGKNMSSDTWGYLGEQKRTNYALREDMTREEFVQEVTEGLTPPPQYFAKNAMMNKMGYDSYDEVMKRGNHPLTPENFEAVVEANDALIMDVRTQDEFAAGHIPGAIFIGLDGSFAPWVGALITDLKQPIVIVAPKERAEETVMRLSRVGYDNTLGYLDGGMGAWVASGRDVGKTRSIDVTTLAENYGDIPADQIMDVRRPAEFLSQHVEGAQNFPLDYLNNNMARIKTGETYYLYCRTGYRSMVAASILMARGYQNVVDVQSGWEEMEKTGIPKTEYICPTTIDQEVIDQALEAVV